MRVGVFGGSFDPVHNGHLFVAEAVRESSGLDRVLFVPTREGKHYRGGAMSASPATFSPGAVADLLSKNFQATSSAGLNPSAQLLGAMAGAALMALHYAAHWKLTPDPAAKLGIFCTIGAVHSPALNILSETLGTAVLVAVVGAIFSHGVSANGPAAGLGPWLVASLVWGIGLSLGGTTGYAINPARDLGPRIVHWLLPIPGKGGSNWSYAPLPIIGDFAGAALAGLLLRYAHL